MGPLTEEQRALIEKWYLYAQKVAYDQARRPYDDHEVRTAAHDALINAARYYEEGRGCRNFQSFYKHCLLKQLSRKFKERLAKRLAPIPEGLEIPYTPESPRFETQEFANYLQARLPAHHAEVVDKYIGKGLNFNQISEPLGCVPQNVINFYRLALRDMKRRAIWSYFPRYTGTGAVAPMELPKRAPMRSTQRAIRDTNPAATRQNIQLLGDSKLTYVEIAAQVGIHPQTVYRILRDQRQLHRAE